MTGSPGLRERKKEATRVALRTAALRLALERGPGNVRVDDIAEAAGVSPRTYNNYFASREQAIIAAVTAERTSRIAAAVTSRPAEVELAEAVIDAVAGQYCDPGPDDHAAMLMVISTAALRSSYVDTATAAAESLAEALHTRRPAIDRETAETLAAAVGAATRLALQRWLEAMVAPSSIPGFVVPAGSLPGLVRAALEPLAPALDAAGRQQPSAAATLS